MTKTDVEAIGDKIKDLSELLLDFLENQDQTPLVSIAALNSAALFLAHTLEVDLEGADRFEETGEVMKFNA